MLGFNVVKKCNMFMMYMYVMYMYMCIPGVCVCIYVYTTLLKRRKTGKKDEKIETVFKQLLKVLKIDKEKFLMKLNVT